MKSVTKGSLRVLSRRALAAAGAASACVSAAACKDNTSPTKLTPSVVQAEAPDTLAGIVGTVLDTQLVVRVVDASGVPVPSTIVAFTASGAIVNPANPATDDSGLVRATVTLGTVAGTDTVRAAIVTATPPPPVIFIVVAKAGAPAQITTVSGDQQTAPAGTQLPSPLVAQVTDQFGNAVAGVTVAWSTSGSGILGAASSQSDANGMVQVTFTLGASPGAESVTAQVSSSITDTFTETGQ